MTAATDIWVDDKARVHHIDAYHNESTWTRAEAEALFAALGTILDSTAPTPVRYAVQIASTDDTPLMLCNDHSMWSMPRDRWLRMPNPPQPETVVAPVVVALPLGHGRGPGSRDAQPLAEAVIPRPGKPEVPV